MARAAAARPGGRHAGSEGVEEAPTFFLLEAPAAPGETVELSPDEAHHALRVLRLAAGSIVPATDGLGGRYRLRLVARGRRCLAEVLARESESPVTPRLEIGVGAGRRDRFLWCVEKLTELGVARVTPLVSAAVQRPAALIGAGGERYQARALARARAALKQSKGAHLPEIAEPEAVGAWSARPFQGSSLLLAFPAPGVPPLAAAAAAAGADRVRLAVGPEGGFLPDEEAGLAREGFVPAHLGARRLRFETAALAAACQVMAVAELGAEPPSAAPAGEAPRRPAEDACSS
jgi:16S rRNA (uracil1498-N3)-methyltransferase